MPDRQTGSRRTRSAPGGRTGDGATSRTQALAVLGARPSSAAIARSEAPCARISRALRRSSGVRAVDPAWQAIRTDRPVQSRAPAPPWCNGQHARFSTLKQGFDSPWGYSCRAAEAESLRAEEAGLVVVRLGVVVAQRLGVARAEQHGRRRLRRGADLVARAGHAEVAAPPVGAAQRDQPRARAEGAAVDDAPGLAVGIDMQAVEPPDESEGPVEDEHVALGLPARVDHRGRELPVAATSDTR